MDDAVLIRWPTPTPAATGTGDPGAGRNADMVVSAVGVPQIEAEAPVTPHTARVAAWDIARAMAVFGMVTVNFHSILDAENGPGWLVRACDMLYGRAAVLFVMLAGAGLTLMSRSANRTTGSGGGLGAVRKRLFKRSAVLLVMGMIFIHWWNADILHFYSLFLCIGALLLGSSDRQLLVLAAAVWGSSVLLFLIPDWFAVWQESPVCYRIGDGLEEAVKDLFFTGYYPAFPWFSLMLLGMWLARQDLNHPATLVRIMAVCAGIFVVIEVLNAKLPDAFTGIDPDGPVAVLLGTGVFPTSPLFILSAAANAVTVVAGCLLATRSIGFRRAATPLQAAGRLSLTFYIGHIFLGLWLSPMLFRVMHDPSVVSVVAGAVGFSVLSMVFAAWWCRHFANGPLESIMRWLSQ